MSTRTGAFLSYVLEWITGIIFLFVGKDNPDIKYHAAQSVVWFGSLTVVSVVISIVASFNGLGFLGYIAGNTFSLLNIVAFVSWIYCLVKAWTGNGARFELPIVGGFVTPYAEQLANRVK